MKRSKTWDRAAVAACVIMIATACYFPAAEVPDGLVGNQVEGLGALMLGFLGPSLVPWLANPLHYLGCALLLLGRHRAAFAAGIVAVTLALSTLVLLTEIVPHHDRVLRLLPGYYFWLTAHALLAISAGILALANRPPV